MNADVEEAISCPRRETLLAILNGETQVDDSTESHLRSCTICQNQLDRLTGAATLESIRDELQSADRYPFLDPPSRPGDLGTLVAAGHDDDDAHGVFFVAEEIGRGGMGVVLRATQKDLEREVAIKVLMNDVGEGSVDRFTREAKAAASVSGDHVVSVHFFGVTRDGKHFLVMPWIDGRSLDERVSELRDAPRAAAEAIAQVADGLQTVHDAGLIHRDVKPANVLFNSKTRRYQLTDFGLVRYQESGHTLTQASVLAGTPRYMSPEQADGSSPVSPASDLYSLGITLYETLTGSAPFQGNPLQILEQHRETEPLRPSKLNPSIPAGLERVCLKALNKSPERRYASAAAFGEDLRRFLDGRPVLAKDAAPVERAWMWLERNRTVATLLATIVATLVLGIVGVSVMWYRAASLANQLQSTSIELSENQKELRQSVSDFQEKVFSDESLHWQMTPEFRSQMFQDVVTYLDRFAKLEPLDASGLDPIARDYLMVAESSIQTDDWASAQPPLQRAVDRLQSEPVESLSAANCQMLTKALLRLLEAPSEPTGGLAGKTASPSSDPERSRRGQEARRAAERAVALTNSDSSKFRLLQVRCTGAGRQVSDDQTSETFEDRLSEAETLWMRIYEEEQPVQREWMMETMRWLVNQRWAWIRTLPVERQNTEYSGVKNRLTLRFKYYLQSKNHPTMAADQMTARNEYYLSESLAKAGRVEEALEVADAAAKRLNHFADLQPQNLTWQMHAAGAHLRVRDLATDLKQYQTANDASISGLRKTINLKSRIPSDLSIAISVIKQFNRKGMLSRQLGQNATAIDEFYFGAQDCRLLHDETDNVADWAFEMRLHLIGKIAPHWRDLPDAKVSKFYETVEIPWPKTVAKRYGREVAQRVEEIVSGRQTVPEPAVPEGYQWPGSDRN